MARVPELPPEDEMISDRDLWDLKEEVIKKPGIDPYAKNSNGDTLLHILARYAPHVYINGLIDAYKNRYPDYDINVRNNQGQTALHVGANRVNNVISTLLGGGLDPLMKDNEGKLPIDYVTGGQFYEDYFIQYMKKAKAERADFEKVMELLKNKVSAKELKESKLNLNARSAVNIKEGRTPIQMTMMTGDWTSFNTLIEAGALKSEGINVEEVVRSDMGLKAFKEAIKRGDLDSFNIMIKKGVLIGNEQAQEIVRSERGEEVFKDTIKNGDKKSFESFVSAGILKEKDINSFKITGEKSLEALYLISEQNHSSTKDMFQVLIKIGEVSKYEKMQALAESEKVNSSLLKGIFNADIVNQKQRLLEDYVKQGNQVVVKKLIDAGISGYDLVEQAIKHGYSEHFELLVKAGALIEGNAKFLMIGNGKGLEALKLAFGQNHEEKTNFIRLLVEADTRSDFEKMYDLARAKGMSVEMLEELPIELNPKNKKGETLTYILEQESSSHLGKILKAKGRVEFKEVMNWLEKGVNAEKLKSLGLTLNPKNAKGHTPIQEVIFTGDKQNFGILVNAGALIEENAKSFMISSKESLNTLDLIFKENPASMKDMFQALWDADTRSDFEKMYELATSEKVSVEMLEKFPFEINPKNEKGETLTYTLAIKSSPFLEKVLEVEGRLEFEKVMDFLSQDRSVINLKESGLVLNLKGAEGRTPIEETIVTGNKEAFETLVEAGALGVTKDSKKITSPGNLETIKLILKQGHFYVKDMLQILVDVDPRSDFEKVYDLARSDKVSVEMLDRLPIDIDSKNTVNEAITSVKGFSGLEKVIQSIEQGNLKTF